MLVLHLDRLYRVAFAELGEEPFRLALAVALDHCVGRAEDCVRRAVVLLESDRVRPGEVALEVEDVGDVRAAERVHGLIGVSDREDIAVLAAEELQEPVLGVVRVLVLVDEDVAERRLPPLTGFREPLEHVDGQHQQVVEVDRVGAEQLALVQPVHLRNGLVIERADPGHVLVRADQPVLGVRDLRVDAAGREPLRVAAELLQARLHDAHLVRLVVDRERRAVAEPAGLRAEDAAAGRVEGEDPDRAGRVAEHPLEPLPHLPGRLVRERDREDLVRLHAAHPDQVRDTVGEHARLAGARTRDHEQRALGVEHRLALRVVQHCEMVVGRGGRGGGRHVRAPSPSG